MLVTDDLDDASIERAGALVAREHAAARSYGRSCPGFDRTAFAARCSNCATAAIAAWS